MRKRVIVLMIAIFSFSSMMWSMDDPNPQTVVQITDDGKKKLPVDIPPITIDRSQSNISIVGRAKSIKHAQEMLREVGNTHRTARGTPPAAPVQKRKFNIDSGADDDVPTSTIPAAKGTISPSTIASLTNKLPDQKSYLEDEVWELIKAVNPTLYDFGKKHDLDLNRLAIFADCARRGAVPEVFTEFFNPDDQNKEKSFPQRILDYIFGDPQASIHQGYEALAKNKSETYETVLLDLYKMIADAEDKGHVNRSALADTHTSIMAQQLNAKESDWRTQVMLNLIQVCSQAGLAAWAIYGQIGSSGGGHGNSTGH